MAGSTTTDSSGVYGSLGISAAGNTPSGRYGAVTWTDTNGNLWLFGGYNYTSGDTYFNDLWKFDTTVNQWAWMGGPYIINQPGVYGKQGTPAPANIPGARINAVTWTDGKGNFWLFGGSGIQTGGGVGHTPILIEALSCPVRTCGA